MEPETIAPQLHALLDGAEYPLDRHPTFDEACALARQHGYLIIYGSGDALISFDGAFRDETGAREETTLWVDAEGILPLRNGDLDAPPITIVQAQELVGRYRDAVRVTVTRGGLTAFWSYSISHAALRPGCEPRFKIMEDGALFCQGLIVKLPS